jgi:predicted AAA+ superfamily ATPase
VEGEGEDGEGIGCCTGATGRRLIADRKTIYNLQGMIDRAIAAQVRDRLSRHPAVALVGPRQAGKTTLARSFGGAYFDLEQAGDRTRLDIEWERVCAQRNLVVLDEAQSWPDVFARLRGAIDAARKRHGRFLLLGSVSPALMTQVSESLAGRLALMELTPFLTWEVPAAAWTEHWLRGGYPDGGILDPARFPEWQESYLALLAQRDLPTWGLPARPQTIERLLRMTAAVHGQLLNLSRLGQSLGLSHPTVRTYLDHLEGAFLVRRLPPHAANLKKRLIKSPKLYWRDSGLLHALLRVRSWDDLLAQPWAGASWEGFVIEQILATLAIVGRRADASFLRTSDGHEIDLLLSMGRERWAVVVKLTSAPDPHDLERLDRAANLVRASKRIVVSQTPHPIFSDRRISCDLASLLTFLRDGA